MSECCLFCGADLPPKLIYRTSWQGVTADWNAREVWAEGFHAFLPRIQLSILFLLMRAKGERVPLEMFESLTDPDNISDSLRTHICILRKWIANSPLPFELPRENSWVGGYQLVSTG